MNLIFYINQDKNLEGNMFAMVDHKQSATQHKELQLKKGI
jgi:hypothetical protein